jgi:hypothetical protein
MSSLSNVSVWVYFTKIIPYLITTDVPASRITVCTVLQESIGSPSAAKMLKAYKGAIRA